MSLYCGSTISQMFHMFNCKLSNMKWKPCHCTHTQIKVAYFSTWFAFVFKHVRGIKGICPRHPTSKPQHPCALFFIPVSQDDLQTIYETVHKLFLKVGLTSWTRRCKVLCADLLILACAAQLHYNERLLKLACKRFKRVQMDKIHLYYLT